MIILSVRTKRNAVLRVLLGAAAGLLFGLQGWQLARGGYPISMPWYGAVWVFVRHVALGIAIAVTRYPSWWKRGAGLGLLFSLPSAVVLSTVDGRLAPLTIALCAGSMAAGVIIAFLTDTICPREADGAAERAPVVRKPEHHVEAPVQRPRATGTSQRLAEGKRALDDLSRQRTLRGDAAFGHEAEDRIIWRELIELELQEIDAQLNHLPGDKNKGR